MQMYEDIYEDIGLLEAPVMSCINFMSSFLYLDLAHLLLPDLVVAVRDQIFSHLSKK